MRTRWFLLLLYVVVSVNINSQIIKVGDLAPEIKLQSIDGQAMSLSSLRGKVVLIDFWASWCKPCRKENATLVNTYNTFKDTVFKNGNGFTIYSVSLDMKKKAWEKAIGADGLIWPYHVSDLKGWRSDVSKQYGVKGIPANFLIDAEGVVIAVNLRGEELESKLWKLRKKPWYIFW